MITKRLTLTVVILAFVLCDASARAQFRRGLFGESTEITLYPIDAPAVLLPAGSLTLDVRNGSTAAARIVERVHERLARQLGDNDPRLQLVDQGGRLVVVATIMEWNQSRRNSTKYVSETRQVGTREVIDKNGKKKTEPVYEYGRNRPSVVIQASARLRIEVRTAGGTTMADESARHAISEEHVLDAGPPSREEIEDRLIDGVVQRAAGRVSPGRTGVTVLVARSDEVDKLNSLAENRKWTEWLVALERIPAHRDRRRDGYRLHNIAVANEALAYESADAQESLSRLERAEAQIRQAAALNTSEKYFGESAERIARSLAAYRRLAELYAAAGAAPADSPVAAPAPPRVEAPAADPSAAAMTNKDVIDLRAAGLDDDNLIAAINDAKAVRFDLSPAGLKTLLTAKVSNKVIAAMRARKH